MVLVTPNRASRVASRPDMTPGITAFRITIDRPIPNALKIPILVDKDRERTIRFDKTNAVD